MQPYVCTYLNALKMLPNVWRYSLIRMFISLPFTFTKVPLITAFNKEHWSWCLIIIAFVAVVSFMENNYCLNRVSTTCNHCCLIISSISVEVNKKSASIYTAKNNKICNVLWLVTCDLLSESICICMHSQWINLTIISNVAVMYLSLETNHTLSYTSYVVLHNKSCL